MSAESVETMIRFEVRADVGLVAETGIDAALRAGDLDYIPSRNTIIVRDNDSSHRTTGGVSITGVMEYCGLNGLFKPLRTLIASI